MFVYTRTVLGMVVLCNVSCYAMNLQQITSTLTQPENRNITKIWCE